MKPSEFSLFFLFTKFVCARVLPRVRMNWRLLHAEFSSLFADQLASLAGCESNAQTIKLVCSMNNHLLLGYYLQKLYSYYWQNFENLLHDKFDLIAEKYHRLVAMQYESACKYMDAFSHALHSDLKRIVEQKFFSSQWESDVAGFVVVKRLIKSRIFFAKATLVTLDCFESNGADGGLFSSSLSLLLNEICGGRLGTVITGVRLAEDLVMQLALRACESLVRVYIEQLLLTFGNGLVSNIPPADAILPAEEFQRTLSTQGRMSFRASFSMPSPSASFSSSRSSFSYFQNISISSKPFRALNLDIINRLNEELQLLLAMSEEIRTALAGGGDKSGNPLRVIRSPRKVRRPLAIIYEKYIKPNMADPKDNFEQSGASRGDGPQGQFNSKPLFDGVWQPLQHVIYAAQMDKQYLPAFVQDCLFADFGYSAAVKMYSFLLFWRGELAESIRSDYHRHFSKWNPDRSLVGVCQIPLVHSIKSANILAP